jgi:hypothetical protein
MKCQNLSVGHVPDRMKIIAKNSFNCFVLTCIKQKVKNFIFYVGSTVLISKGYDPLTIYKGVHKTLLIPMLLIFFEHSK